MSRRYSMELRRLKPSIISRFNLEDKKDIMTKYLVEKRNLKDIYEHYRGRGVEDKEVMSEMINKIKTTVDYNGVKITATCVGHKTQSYWESEDDLFYTPIKMNQLSRSEKSIYFSKPRKTNNYGRR